MNLNEKMLEYVQKQIEEQDDILHSIFYKLSTGKDYGSDFLLAELQKAMSKNRYLKHIFVDNSIICDHCKEIGLID